jgi:hypothetical protein
MWARWPAVPTTPFFAKRYRPISPAVVAIGGILRRVLRCVRIDDVLVDETLVPVEIVYADNS